VHAAAAATAAAAAAAAAMAVAAATAMEQQQRQQKFNEFLTTSRAPCLVVFTVLFTNITASSFVVHSFSTSTTTHPAR
jgi:hypothetical protein